MKARFYFDVEFDGTKTDAESLADAFDKVLDLGRVDLADCWEEYGGEPKFTGAFVLDTTTAKKLAKELDAVVEGLAESLSPIRKFLRQIAQV